jgi:transcriptional regulator with XRE-family HTH domain
MEYQNVGQNVQHFRHQADLSQFDLAVKAGVPVGTIQGWEQGRRIPRLDQLIKVAQALGVGLDQLVGPEPPKPRRRKEK